MDLSRRVSRRGATPIVTENDPYAIEPADSQGRSRDAPRESPPCPRKLEYFTRVKTYQRSDFFFFFFFFLTNKIYLFTWKETLSESLFFLIRVFKTKKG